MSHLLWPDDVPNTPRERRKQREADAAAARLLAAPKAIGNDSPEHRDSRKIAQPADEIDWPGYCREEAIRLGKRERKLKGEAETLAAWTDALKRDQQRIDDQKRGLRIAWIAWSIAAIWMMCVGNGLLGR